MRVKGNVQIMLVLGLVFGASEGLKPSLGIGFKFLYCVFLSPVPFRLQSLRYYELIGFQKRDNKGRHACTTDC